MKRLLFVLAVGGAAFVLGGGCGAPPVTGGATESFARYRPSGTSPVVVLPFANDTADMDAPKIVREAFIEGVQGRGCSMVPVEKSDEILRDNGITQGGQLGGVDPETLKELLGVDYAFYGNVEGFSSKNIGIYVSRWVKAGFKLVYTPKAEVLWEAVGEAKAREYHLPSEDDASSDEDAWKKAAARGLVSGLLQSALKKEAAKAVKNALSTLPAFAEPGPEVEAPAEVEAQKPEVAPAGHVVVPGPVGAPPDLDAAFGRLAAKAGIEFEDSFLASRLELPGAGHPPKLTVRRYLAVLQLGMERGGGKVQSLENWRREGNAYKVELRGRERRADLVFRYSPDQGVTLARAVDPETGKPVPAFGSRRAVKRKK